MGKSSQPAGSPALGHEPARFDLLEQTVSLEGPVPGPGDSYGLDPVPIPGEWILEGDPLTREKALARSTDGVASAFMWDCSSGRFQWKYGMEEIAHVLQGFAIIETAGTNRRLQAGDTHVFPAGSRVRWTVPDYVRTVTFRLPTPAGTPLGRRLQAAFGAPWRTRRARSR